MLDFKDYLSVKQIILTNIISKTEATLRSVVLKIKTSRVYAFTLIELLVVIVIIGVLATLATVALSSARGKARDARRVSDLKQISTALELYMADENVYPSLITAGQPMIGATSGKTYMSKVPADPSTNIDYAYGGSDTKFTLRTTIENAVNDVSAGPVIVTNGSGVKQAANVDSRYMDSDLTFGGSLIGHWTLDGNTGTRDLSGNGNNGILTMGTSTVVTSTGRFGEVNGGFIFNGVNNYVTSPSFNNYPSAWSDPITFSIWINIPSSATWHNDGKGNIISKGSYGGSFGLVRYMTNNIVGFFSRGNITAENSQIYGTISRDTWNHIVGTQVSGTTSLYINGINKGSSYASLSGAPDSGNWDIGTTKVFEGNYGSYFDGYISDVRVYNKVLSQSDVTVLYNASRP